MNRRLGQPGIRRRFRSCLRRGPSSLRPLLESLEGRMMLDAGANQDPGDLVLGRTLATPATAAAATPAPCYFIGEVQNNQVTITYTLYNEQTDPETGVSLIDHAPAGRDRSQCLAEPCPERPEPHVEPGDDPGLREPACR